jgi:hypothetical protein
MNQAYPTYNGLATSWADIGIKITPEGGSIVETADIAGIKVSVKGEVGSVEGASGGRIMKRTTGKVTYDVSIEFYRDGFQKYLEALAALAPSRGNQKLVSLVHQDFLVQHSLPGSSTIYEQKIKGVRYMGRDMDHKEGTDADKVAVTLSVAEVVDIINGQEIVLL